MNNIEITLTNGNNTLEFSLSTKLSLRDTKDRINQAIDNNKQVLFLDEEYEEWIIFPYDLLKNMAISIRQVKNDE